MRKRRLDFDAERPSYLPSVEEIDLMKRVIREENEARQREDVEDEDEEESLAETIRSWSRA